MNNIWVDSDLIWTPNLHFSNRLQDFGPLQEVSLRSNIGFDGKARIEIDTFGKIEESLSDSPGRFV